MWWQVQYANWIRYGKDAADATASGLSVVMDVAETAYAVKQLGAKKIVKRVAMHTGKETGKGEDIESWQNSIEDDWQWWRRRRTKVAYKFIINRSVHNYSKLSISLLRSFHESLMNKTISLIISYLLQATMRLIVISMNLAIHKSYHATPCTERLLDLMISLIAENPKRQMESHTTETGAQAQRELWSRAMCSSTVSSCKSLNFCPTLRCLLILHSVLWIAIWFQIG